MVSEWQGPHFVTRVLENNNYEVDLGRRKTVMHINSLRQYYPRQHDGTAVNQLMTVRYADRGDDAGGTLEGAHELDTAGDRPETADYLDWNDDMGASGEHEFRIGTQLTDAQRQQMKDVLTEFPDVFDSKPGTTDLITHKIELTDNTPVWQPPYRIPDALREETEKELNKLLEQDIIQYDPDTKYNSPLIVIKKKQGGIRLVNNFIQLNRKTIPERYPMTNANQLLSRVAGAHFLTKIDLNKYYFQLKLSPESRSCTGFYTEWGTFSYKRLPQGLSTSATTAQRLIDRILRGANKWAGALLDDILIYSATWNEHLNHIRDVLQRLRAAGLTANIQKCTFASNDMEVLGHRVCDGKLMPSNEKVKAITEWKRPKNKTQLRSFLGTTNFFHAFIDHYAAIASPLTELLAKSRVDKLNWGEKQQEAFDQLKLAITKKPVIRPPDPSKDMEMVCDGSSTGISAILTQFDEHKQSNYVIAYASRKLTKAEQRYPIIEIELMAIIFGLQKFRHYVHSRKLRVYTDHRPLVWLNSLIKHSNRLARWVLLLQEYNIDTTYIAGKNQIADGLTRTP